MNNRIFVARPMKEGTSYREAYDIIVPCFSQSDQNRVAAKIEEALKGCTDPEESEKAESMIEDVIDTLIEVGNGVTDKMLHEAAERMTSK